MQVRRFGIEGPFEFTFPIHKDSRGFFTETFHLQKLQAEGLTESNWVQDNQSLSSQVHTLRGMHFQLAPLAQSKIIRVLSGAIFDVAVDLRLGSKTFGKWFGVELTAHQNNQLYLPSQFAHGFLTLEPNVVVGYKVSNFYSRAHERSLNWADEEIGIAWPLYKGELPLLSDKDAVAPRLAELRSELKTHQ